jgi:radical SAM superfamily enzyme YgiQ (UPF0313 family)
MLVWPPGPVLYDNLCYHYCAFGEVAGYLAGLTRLEVIDAGAEEMSHAELARRILRFRPQVVILYHDFDLLPSIPPVIDLVRSVSEARIVSYGPPGMYCPDPFLEKGADGVACDGDWEYALASFIRDPKEPEGIATRGSRRPGARLPPEDWGFPLLDRLPLDRYRAMGREARSSSERAGLAGLTEMSITLSRGCGRRCGFCKTSLVEGSEERRRDLSTALRFIERAFAEHGFDYLSVYSPNFSSQRSYAVDFARGMRRLDLAWKCVTAVDLLDPELVETMARSGCRRIGVGVESLSSEAMATLSTGKRVGGLDELLEQCRRHGVDLHCFLMLGIPGEERASFVEAVRWLLGAGASVRITSYVPCDELDEHTSWDDLVRMNRKTHRCSLPAGMSEREFAEIIFDQESWLRRIAVGRE